MLSDVWKNKLAANLDKMVVIQAEMPKTYKGDSEWRRMSKENKELQLQIINYKKSFNGSNNTKA